MRWWVTKDAVLSSIAKQRDVGKLSLLIRLFAELGEMRPLVEFATDEFFHELGVVEQTYDTLEGASKSEAIAPDERFSALDGLVYSDLRNGDLKESQATS